MLGVTGILPRPTLTGFANPELPVSVAGCPGLHQCKNAGLLAYSLRAEKALNSREAFGFVATC